MAVAISDSLDQVLGHWYRRASESQSAHYSAAKFFGRLHYWLGIPSVIFSVFVGTSVFATLGLQTDVVTKVTVGLVSVLAAILSALQTFLRFSERSEKHRLAGTHYGAIRREIEGFKATPPTSPDTARQMVDRIREKMDSLAEEAPEIPTRIWHQTERKFQAKQPSATTVVSKAP